MRHKISERTLYDYKGRVQFYCAAVFVVVAIALYLITDNPWSASIGMFCFILAHGLMLLMQALFYEAEDSAERDIERVSDGLRFHYRETESTIRFADLAEIRLDRAKGEIVGVTLIKKDGLRIGVDHYDDMDQICAHLFEGVDDNVRIK